MNLTSKILRCLVGLVAAIALASCGGGANDSSANAASTPFLLPSNAITIPVASVSLSNASISGGTTATLSIPVASDSALGKLSVGSLFFTSSTATNHIPVAYKVAAKVMTGTSTFTVQLARPPMTEVMQSVNLQISQTLSINDVLTESLPTGTILVDKTTAKIVDSSGALVNLPTAAIASVKSSVSAYLPEATAVSVAAPADVTAFFKKLFTIGIDNSKENTFCVLIPKAENQSFLAPGGISTVTVMSSFCLVNPRVSGSQSGELKAGSKLVANVSFDAQTTFDASIQIDGLNLSTSLLPQSIQEQGFSNRNLELMNYDVRLEGVDIPPNKVVLANLVFRSKTLMDWTPTAGLGLPNVTRTPFAVVMLVLVEAELKADVKAFATANASATVGVEAELAVEFGALGGMKTPSINLKRKDFNANPIEMGYGASFPGSGQAANSSIASTRLVVTIRVAPAALGFAPLAIDFSLGGAWRLEPRLTVDIQPENYLSSNLCINYSRRYFTTALWIINVRAIGGDKKDPSFDRSFSASDAFFIRLLVGDPNNAIPGIDYSVNTALTPVTETRQLGFTTPKDCLGRLGTRTEFGAIIQNSPATGSPPVGLLASFTASILNANQLSSGNLTSYQWTIYKPDGTISGQAINNNGTVAIQTIFPASGNYNLRVVATAAGEAPYTVNKAIFIGGVTCPIGSTLNSSGVCAPDTTTQPVGDVVTITPQIAVLNVSTTFTVKSVAGLLTNSLVFSLADCTNLVAVAGGTGFERSFVCTPTGPSGVRVGLVKSRAENTFGQEFSVTYSNSAPTITSVSPLSGTRGFTINVGVAGQNLPGTLIVNIDGQSVGCTASSRNATAATFSCPLDVSGARQLKVQSNTLAAGGTVLANYTFQVTN